MIPGSARSAGEGIDYPLQCSWASLLAQMVKNLPAMWKTWVQSLGWEDTLEKGTATHSSILAWRILWTEEPRRLQSMGSQRVGHDFPTFTFTSHSPYILYLSHLSFCIFFLVLAACVHSLCFCGSHVPMTLFKLFFSGMSLPSFIQ